ncbi:Transcriptional regulators [Butyrivibrio fibrisolvens 16/4]|nr:Transcriptional regulators [Butyrivibrio fibrisolvens 16/4]
MAGKKVTIKDVAREAGVSVATVSYVVNGRTDLKISDETRKRVLQVINLLNYSPNQAAKALASKRKIR